MARLWLCLLLAGCDFGAPGAIDGGVGGDGDAPPDTLVVPCIGVRYGADPFSVCLPAEPTGSVTVDVPAMINTDACTSTIPGLLIGQKLTQGPVGAPLVCVLAAGSITMTGTIKVDAQGTLPVVLLAHTDLAIGSTVLIDVSGAISGAGHDAAGCTVVNGGNDNNGGGGGAGGSFGTLGGNGAAVDGAGQGATAAGAVTPTFLRGGCAAGRGGNAQNSPGGVGGRGGGAIYLLAGTLLQIEGRINASGGAGLATTGDGRGGGGGGGSGGMIALWGGNRIMTSPTTQIWANGGGAAAGSDGNSNRGEDGGTSTSPGAAAPGGASTANGCTNGGDGAIDALPGTSGGSGGNKSGGGGGGGVGWIENVGGGAISPGQISPAAR